MAKHAANTRIRVLRDDTPSSAASYVLYWMNAARRAESNFALDRALWWCRELGLPLLVFEGLRVGYEHASDRLHTFVLQGMGDNQAAFDRAGVRYLPWTEREQGQGQGLLARLAARAAVVVTDDFPAFFLPRMLDAAASKLRTRFEAIDSNGLVPMRATDREFTRAHSFRRYLQGCLPEHLAVMPSEEPLAGYDLGRATVPADALEVGGFLTSKELANPAALAASLPIDHEVGIVDMTGGPSAGSERLHTFVEDELDAYGVRRNHPDDDGTSGLSPWLHFGHISAHQLLRAIADRYDWSPARLGPPNGGAREGWWDLPASVEGFMDELVTWRELSLNLCATRPDHARIDSLPAWAHKTIAEHADDPRDEVYSLEQLEHGHTGDALWNAAQNQLRQEGRMHNYLRMLWGKLIYQWSPDARTAWDTMVHLNDRWAIDGRDPNSYSGIGWVLGRFDRAWGPERPVFGKLRYMTSGSTRRKLRVRRYLERHGGQTVLAIA